MTLMTLNTKFQLPRSKVLVSQSLWSFGLSQWLNNDVLGIKKFRKTSFFPKKFKNVWNVIVYLWNVEKIKNFAILSGNKRKKDHTLKNLPWFFGTGRKLWFCWFFRRSLETVNINFIPNSQMLINSSFKRPGFMTVITL